MSSFPQHKDAKASKEDCTEPGGGADVEDTAASVDSAVPSPMSGVSDSSLLSIYHNCVTISYSWLCWSAYFNRIL